MIDSDTASEASDLVVAPHLETGIKDTAVVGRVTVPGKVRDLTATAIDTSQISLVWRPPADTGSSAIAAYQIEESRDNSNWNIIAAVFAPDTTYTRMGLTPNTTYYYRVSAINGTGAGDASDVASAKTEGTGAPGAPTGLTATADGQSAIDLSWTAPADTGTSAITGYRIDRLSDDFLTWVVLVANTNATATTYKDTGLDPGTFRIYRVAAINATGPGPTSDVADATTDPAGAPGAPTNLTATADGQTAIDLAWTAPADTGTSAITGYQIEVSEDGTTWSDLKDDTESTATTYEHSGLQAGDTRYYRVSAINGSGAGDPSDVASATTDSPPGKPTKLTATADGDTAIDLAWEAPADTGSSAITGYRIEVSEDGTNWSNLVDDTESTVTTHEHSGLQAGDTRHYRVSAINGTGAGDPSDVASATTDSPPGKPTDLAATVDGPTQISLLWRAPADTGSSAIAAYQIEESGDGSTWNVITTVVAPDTTYTQTGLTPNTTYHYRVSAVNSTGVGDPSDAASATTESTGVPGAPTGLTATADGQSAIDLSWTEPADTGTSAITGYRIDRLSDDFLTWVVLVANTGTMATTYEDTGLDPGTFRAYRVAAINGAGPGPESDPADATTEEAGAPGAPTNLTATADGQTAIDLAWTAPADTGTSAITGYRIEVSEDGSAWSDLVEDTESTATTHKHSGLQAGDTRYYRVSAINSSGAGDPSDVASATTDSPPGKPTDLAATVDGPTQISLLWRAPADTGSSAIAAYQIEESGDGSTWNVITTVVAPDTTYTQTGLTPNTTYHYRVSAVNSTGVGDPSDAASATTESTGVPGAPTGLTATADGQSAIDLSWTEPADTGTSAITGYRIDRLSDDFLTWVVLVANTGTMATTYEDTGLDPGTFRAYRVAAINGAGPGPESDPADATTEEAGAPGAPTNLTATADGQTAIDLAWTAPADTGTSAITGYRIEVSEDGSAWSDLVEDTESTATTHKHSGLQAGDTRYYRVSAINGSGTGDPSDAVIATTEGPSHPRVPSRPRDLAAEAVGSSIIHLTWEEPADPGSSALIGYRIEVSRDAGENWTYAEKNTGSTTTDYTFFGLRPGSLRHFRVFAINDIGRSNASNVAHATTAGGKVPEPPTDLTAEADGQTAISLAWNPPADTGTSFILGYRIEVSEDRGVSWVDLTVNTGSAETTYRHAGLQSSTVRHYRVSAINGSGTGLPSDVADAATEDPRVPGAPTGLTAVADGQSAINLEWTPPADAGDSTLTGYRIEVSASGNSWTDLREDTHSTTTTFRQSGLPPASTRHYRVSAISAAGAGSPSSVATATTAAAVPGAPTGLVATAVGQTQIDLAWAAPADNGGSSITGYRIEVSENGNGDWSDLADQTGATSTTYSHTGLSSANTRYYRVSATNAVGAGPASNIAGTTTEAASSEAPRDLHASAVSPERIDLSWTAPADNGGTSITGYRIRVAESADHAWSVLTENTGSAATTYSHTGLDPGSTWHYRVAAINGAGPGPESNTAAASTPARVPGAPTELSTRARGTSWIEISWQAPAAAGGSPITGYRIETREDDGVSWMVLEGDTRSAATRHHHTGLAPGTTVYYRVAAINSVGTGAPSDVATGTTDAVLPDAPGGLTAETAGSSQIDLRWMAPQYDGGGAITGYRIEGSKTGVSTWQVLEADTRSTATAYAHTGLDPDATWYYRVAAINSVGVGDPSHVADATTDPTTPGRPRDLTATSKGTAQIDLAWRAPLSDGGTPLTGYRIDTSEDGGVTWASLVSDTRSTLTVFPDVDLTPGATRHYRVAAINLAGAGEHSAVAFATTDATIPDPPAGLTAVAVDHSQIDLTWETPRFDGGSGIVGYRIDTSEDNGTSWKNLVASTETADTVYAHAGLRPATAYLYRVSGVNEIGTGRPSNSAGATTHATRPDSPTELTAIPVAPTRIDLAWTAPAYDGGASLTGYRIEVSQDGNDWSDLQPTTASTRTDYSHSGLEPGSTRFYRVSAINTMGPGVPSNVATARTDDPVERAARVNEAVLPRFASAMTTSTLSAIAKRIEAVARDDLASTQPGATSVSSLLRQAVRHAPRDGGSAARLLHGASFVLPVGRGASSEQATAAFRLATWGGSQYLGMGEPGGDEVQWDGGMLNLHVGADMRLHRDFLAGVAGTRSSGRYDFTDVTGEKPIDGIYDARMTSLTPYMAWLPGRGGGAMWAAGSYGWGEVVIDDAIGGLRSSDATMTTGSAGASLVLLSSGTSLLRLRGEGWLSQVEVAAARGVDSLTLDMRRARLSLEWSRMFRFESGDEVGFQLEGVTRYGSGDGTDGIGVEVGGGLGIATLSNRIAIDGRGRVLVTDGTGYEEWGVGALVTISPQGGNDGLSVTLAPAWGEATSGVQRLWEHGLAHKVNHRSQSASRRLDARIQYRLPGFRGIPYARLRMVEGGARNFGAGMRYEVARMLELRAEGTRTDGSDRPRHGLALRGNWRLPGGDNGKR